MSFIQYDNYIFDFIHNVMTKLFFQNVLFNLLKTRQVLIGLYNITKQIISLL